MQAFIADIKDKARVNTNFRTVLSTSQHTQIVVMSIPSGEEIGEETHGENDQILYFVEGEGKGVLNGEEVTFNEDDIFLVPAGTTHNFINTGKAPLKIITAYSPPHHPDGTVHRTKEDAVKAEY